MGETIVYALKIALAVACALAFLAAILALLSILINYSANNPSILSEVIGLISVYLPFNAGTVFGILISVGNAVLAFLIAKKVYELTSNTYKSS